MKDTRWESRTEYRWKDKLVQSLPQGRSRRTSSTLSPSRLDKSDGFLSWKSLFFYCCTDSISFAPLRSQGVDTRSSYIREMASAMAPPPCSPKSIYVLANLVSRPQIMRPKDNANSSSKLGMKTLRDSAFADLKTKVTLDNVVGEVFSCTAVG